ncbi:hypothetical protein Halru_1521 [Halovivax ruber XH-70]|uniref:ABC-2 type transport system permease protein n=1 Tax=Halovivax ruber (strain DSM 18193 / JCM 13892 / XH-70) TaxID=797302 RepID=L0IBI7_HALRX|nr:hypothetical protein [Halovivax ruber]AGB16129.1 hypothetical protein Halru_1521 [Halovivax ruber XH-70]
MTSSSEAPADGATERTGPGVGTGYTETPPIRTQLAVTARALAREEWRVHTTLFGGYRFLTMPIFITLFAGGTAWLLTETGTAPDAVLVGIHVCALAFGLYAGTAGFAGSAMLEDVFGTHQFLLGVADTLPLSRRLFLGLFLVKDALFYGCFFVLPMAVGAVGVSGFSDATPISLGGKWLSLWLVFVGGMALTVGAISARTNGVPTWAIAVVALLAAFGAWASGWLDGGTVLVTAHSPGSMAILALSTVLVGSLALAAYKPTHVPPSRTAPERFDGIRRLLPTDDPLVAKVLLELGRSSGGFAKPFVSVGLLFGLVAGSLGIVESITGVAPAPGIFFGGILGVSAFTTYNWLTQFDDVSDYLVLPVSVVDVFRAKQLAFLFVGLPTAGLPYLLAVVWFDATLLDAIAGGAVLVGYSGYYYGLTVALAGFSPNEFLFDGGRFAAFGGGVAIVLVPTLLAAFVLTPPSALSTVVLVCASALLAGVGFVLSTRAATYWADRSMAGTA